ncbi:hypothetical protein N0B16_01325 [Chryseobacterium sp. GMJ5]|uniref:DUF6705 domain-containing protein n=1 Tax=Chryseobacterium gilvum TaxID=2976534 RepID=A0ABT2VX31_9FLAO|nr:DUF6705 family protein [Chryseobacterium gilvum]MCU7613070.1 hypothetical protein [Chryseobacterium gilvum]
MKNIFLIITITLISSLFKSQSVVIDISDSELNQPTGYYSKDMNNVLNQFEGTYLFTNGNTSLKIVLVKKIKQYNNSYYEDLIIGEYQYIVNGVEKINTLSNLNVVYNNQFAKHAIAGSSPINNNNREWKCPQCNLNEKRLRAKIIDRTTDRHATILIRKTIVNGQEVLQVKVRDVLPDFENVSPLEFSLPKGEFTMIKQ